MIKKIFIFFLRSGIYLYFRFSTLRAPAEVHRDLQTACDKYLQVFCTLKKTLLIVVFIIRQRLIARLTLVIFEFNNYDIYLHRIVVDKSQTNEDILRIDQMTGPCSNLTALFMRLL